MPQQVLWKSAVASGAREVPVDVGEKAAGTVSSTYQMQSAPRGGLKRSREAQIVGQSQQSARASKRCGLPEFAETLHAGQHAGFDRALRLGFS